MCMLSFPFSSLVNACASLRQSGPICEVKCVYSSYMWSYMYASSEQPSDVDDRRVTIAVFVAIEKEVTIFDFSFNFSFLTTIRNSTSHRKYNRCIVAPVLNASPHCVYNDHEHFKKSSWLTGFMEMWIFTLKFS